MQYNPWTLFFRKSPLIFRLPLEKSVRKSGTSASGVEAPVSSLTLIVRLESASRMSRQGSGLGTLPEIRQAQLATSVFFRHTSSCRRCCSGLLRFGMLSTSSLMLPKSVRLCKPCYIERLRVATSLISSEVNNS